MRHYIILNLLLSVFVLTLAESSLGESYIGVQAGMSFGNRLKDMKAGENFNYPEAPSFNDPDTYFANSTLTDDVELDESFLINIKAGHYFKKLPFLGIEIDASYHEPNFEEQIVEIDLNRPFNAGGSSKFKELQLEADVKHIAVGASVMLRAHKFKKVTPYIGGGPTINYMSFKGTGVSGIRADPGFDVNDPNNRVIAPSFKESTWEIGVQGKAGIRFNITERFAIDTEYKVQYIPNSSIDQFRSFVKPESDFISHQILAGIVYKF